MKTHSLLLIEPNVDISESLQDLFCSEGYRVAHGRSIDILFTETSFSNYDLILVDTGSNCEINRELALRRKSRKIDTPLFVIACYCILDKEKLYIRMGLDGVHAKPLDFDILLQQIDEILEGNNR